MTRRSRAETREARSA